MMNRKAGTEFLVKELSEITPDGYNGAFYKHYLESMTDKQFEDYVQWLIKGGDVCIWLSNTDRKTDINFEDMVARLERLGRPCFQRYITTDPDTKMRVMSDIKQFIGTAELMQQSQIWLKKISAAKDDSQIDDLTGQVMMDSRATGLSSPENAVLAALKLPNTVNEIFTVKGGDVAAAKAYRSDLIETGSTTTNSCLHRGDIAISLRTAHYLFRGRGIDNNLDKRYG